MNPEPVESVRPGAQIDNPALILSSARYQEHGKILRLLTKDFGKISVYAPGAMSSRKRFGGSLEPMSFVQAQLRFPRDSESGGGRLVQILKSDLRDPFTHLRANAELLEAGAFAARAVDECLPEGHADAELFRALGRFLRELGKLADPAAHAGWCRFAFWDWLSRHLGFGELSSGAATEVPASLRPAWDHLMAAEEPDFITFFAQLSATQVPRFTRKDERSLYAKWTEATGIRWPYFEAWIAAF